MFLRSLPGSVIDKTGTNRDCGHAVRVLGWIQHAHLNATGKKVTQTKTSLHPLFNAHEHYYLESMWCTLTFVLCSACCRVIALYKSESAFFFCHLTCNRFELCARVRVGSGWEVLPGYLW